ncbi:MAG: DegT/DnrJ/EryC1/StrS family aminotransferase, partial [Muribaculaceae bacterium]|nr:DegT/DnrJ/EryC1/StrS family aminotransferase [Muribaculaceae bacterium]
DMKRVSRFAATHNCFVLQDACETFNTICATGEEQYYRSGDITTLSFYHPHHLSSYGGGGVICGEKEDYILCDSIAHWGRACKCHIDESLCRNPEGPAHQFTYERPGVNVEMSELNACFGRWQLRQWNSIESKRRQNYTVLYDRLCNNPNLKVWPVGTNEPSRFVFPIQLMNGMNVKEAWTKLADKGVEIRTLMGGATCEQPAYKGLITYDSQDEAVAMADSTFFVGIHHMLTNEDVLAVAKIINQIFS